MIEGDKVQNLNIILPILPELCGIIFSLISCVLLGVEVFEMLESIKNDLIGLCLILGVIPLGIIWVVLMIDFPLMFLINFTIYFILHKINNRRC